MSNSRRLLLFFYLIKIECNVIMKKNYLSKEGHERLEKELRDLKTRGRKEIAAELSEARSKGDLSENAEYDAAKEAQGHLEKKIAELEHTLDRKSTRLNSSHVAISYAVFCLKKKKE